MRVVDANVLLYAVNNASEQHRRARVWLDDALGGSEPVGFAWIVLLAFIRLATHPAVFPRPLAPEQAIDHVKAWLAVGPSVVVEPTPRHVDILASLLAEAGTAGNLVSDAHLAAIALEHDAVLVSFDADIGRFAGLKRAVPDG
jgi:toxin-antitoxin system PIN domain toxin